MIPGRRARTRLAAGPGPARRATGPHPPTGPSTAHRAAANLFGPGDGTPFDERLLPTLTKILHDARRATTRPVLACVAIVAILSAVYFVPGLPQLARDLVYSAIGVVAGLAVLAGVRIHRPEHPRPWYLLAAGVLLFALGDAIWMVLAAMGEEPFPSSADIAYLLGYPALMLAFTYMIAVRVDRGDRSGLLDAAILSVAISLVGWVTMVRPVLNGEGDALGLAIGAAYPMGDLIILGVAIGMLATPGPRLGSFAMLIAGVTIQFGADTLYAFQTADGTAVDGGPLDLAWLVAYALFGLAALVPSMRTVAMPNPVRIAWLSPLRMLFMAFAMLAGPVLVFGHGANDDRDIPLLALGSAFLSVLVLVRLALVVRALGRDNAARRSLEEELSYRAAHDPLTGLANRRGFLERLEATLATRDGHPLTILFLDLDDFKGINDTLGHAAGDGLLVDVADRIRKHLRDQDFAARMGGDEFGVVLRVDEATSIRIAERLLDSLREPVKVADTTVFTRGSIGVAVAGPGATSAQILADADIAMYRAKAMGKSRVCAFADDLRAGVVDRMRLEADLRLAIEQGSLTLEYQPIVDLESGRAAAVEAFIRWMHPERGPISPTVIVPLAEETGLIRPLGDWVLRTACLQVAAWRRTLEPGLSLAINLSPRQAADRDLVRLVQQTAGLAGLPVGALMIEITESALSADDVQTVTNLDELRSLGAWVAIDDFGTGHSSLSALGRLPVDILKIAPIFTAHLDRADDRKLASIVLGLGQTLGLRVVAEGIEREDQLAAIRAIGCPMGQGYLLSLPLSPAGFEALFREERPIGADGHTVRLAFGHPETA